VRFLVVGCGSIGKRHLGNLRFLSAGELMAYDSRPERLEEVKREYGTEVFSDFKEALQQEPAAVLICTPTSLHMEYALSAARSGCHLFIEKPISHSMDGVPGLIEIAAAKKLVTLIGCNFRFNWGLKLVKKLVDENSIGRLFCIRAEFGQYLPGWHPWEDYRQGYSANEALGGGVILDSIHEIDYVYWLMGKVKAVSCFAGKISSLEIDTEDMAEILLRFQNGAIANIHMDYVQRAYNRSCEVIGEEGTITWSFQDSQVRLYSARSNQWQVHTIDASYDVNQMYIDEIEHFLRCIRREEQSSLDAAAAKSELEIVLAAKKSFETGRSVDL